MVAQRLYSAVIAVLLLALIALSLRLLSDELQTQHLRRASIDQIVFPENVPQAASGDRLDALATRALETSPWKIDLAKAATLSSIEKNPRRISNWNRLAYIDAATHGKLTEGGMAALEESFFRSPYGEPQNMQWRLEFTNAYWDGLPNSLKTASLSQITALAYNRRGKAWLRDFSSKSHPEIKSRIERILG